MANTRAFKKKLKAWVDENRVSCPEALVQNDRVWENYHVLGQIVCEEVGYYQWPEEPRDE